MAAAPTNLLLAQNFTTDLNNLGRANSPAIPGGQPPGAPAPNGLQFQTREEAQMFLQAAGRAQPNGANPGGIALSRDAVAALQHAAQVAAVNQAKLVPHGPGAGGNGAMRPAMSVMPPLGQGQNQALANLHTQAQLQAAMNAQRAAAAQAAAAQQSGGLSAANNQAALFLVQNQLAQAQAANNAAQVNAFGLQNGLQNNPIAAAAAAAAAVAATTQAAQARAAVGNANLLQLQQAAQAAGLQRPQAMAWAQNQALQNAAIAQHNLAQQNMAATQNNPALLAAALQAQQARAALQVQQLAQQQAAAAAARPLNPAQQGNVAAQQLQMLRTLQAAQRLAGGQNPNPLVAAAAPAATKPTDAQLQALRSALARTTAGRNANLNAATVLGANTARNGMPPSGPGGPGGPALNSLQQAINLQLLLQQQQRTQAQVQQAQAQVTAAMANNLANMQNNAAAAALNGQLAALQQAAAANSLANGQRQMLHGGAGLAGLGGGGGANTAGLTEAMLQNLQKMQLAKAMQESVAAAGLSVPQVDKAPHGGDAAAAAASNSSKEQRRLALACVALQLARGGMTVEQAIQSGIMGGMSVTDVKFIVECYNAERQRMQSEGAPGGANAGAAAPGGAGAPPQPGANPQPGGVPPPDTPALQGAQMAANGNANGLPGMPGHLQGPVDLGMHGAFLRGMGGPPGMHGAGAPGQLNGLPQLHFAPSPSIPGSPAPSEPAPAAPARMAPLPINGHASAPVSPPRTASQGSPIQGSRLTNAGSDAEGAAQETRSEGGTSEQLAADAAAAVAALNNVKEPFDAFSYAFFGATEGPGVGELLGELETGGGPEGELEAGALPLDAELEGRTGGALGGGGGASLSGLGELAPDQAAWLRAAASANQAMWAGEGAEDGPMSNDEIAARLANLDLGSGFF